MYLDYSRLKADNSLNFVFLLYQYRTKVDGLDIWSFRRSAPNFRFGLSVVHLSAYDNAMEQK